ncbi:DUF3291 domain-containing protein [Litorimonas sp. RW-G-Af-16]|uniref:DUF3291 domain-containing protein n=1 Tax=Litorimonas sp. RW-G-Af-16 TaxID=3241168 RepID=UPI00390C6151
MHLVQVNIAQIKHDSIDAPEMRSFVDRVDAINALAKRSTGFVWTLEGEEGAGATRIEVFPENPNIIIQLSKWESLDSLFHFAYKTAHSKLIAAREDWFVEVPNIANLALWWVKDTHLPTIAEAKSKMTKLFKNGPTPEAFNFRTPFNAAGQAITPKFPKKDCA